ncbi:MAG: aldo/keto reductase [Fimbriimonadaceae bacterium]|nr:aldo/keto reductase [Fimbriimonadaceae bacterium]
MTDVLKLTDLPARRFGRLGWPVRPIGLGGAWLRGRDGRLSIDAGAQTVVAAVELGIDLIDTSIRYGDSELVIGAALSQIAPARRPRIATKSQVIPADQPTADGVLRSCEQSLQRLGLPRVDLFQIHEVEQYGYDRIIGPGGALEGLRRCQAAGLCEGIGVTGRPPDLLARLLQTGEFDAVLTYYEYDLVTSAATRELLPAAVQHDVGVIAGSPARMGYFSRPMGERWARQPAPVQAARYRIEEVLGCPIHETADAAIRYLYSDPRVHNISIGSSQIGSLQSAIQAVLPGPFDEATLLRLRGAVSDGAW